MIDKAGHACLESLAILQSDLVRDHTWVGMVAWAGTVAPRLLLAGARTDRAAGITASRKRTESLLRCSDVITHMHTSQSCSATGTE